MTDLGLMRRNFIFGRSYKLAECKEALDLLTSNIYLIINLLLVHFAINSQIYNIQFAYKIEDLRKIVMQKYHYKKFYRGR